MPGTEIARKQHALGGAAGIALLVFALIYRFTPNMTRVEPQVHPPQVPVVASPAATNPPPLAAQNPAADVPLPMAIPELIKQLPTAEVRSPTPAATGPAPVPSAPAAPPSKAVIALLKKADTALAGGHLLEPKDGNALSLYQQVLATDAENADAKSGVDKIHKALIELMAAAIDHGDEAESVRLLAVVEGLPHDAAELEPMQARLKTLKQVNPLLTQAADLLTQGHAIEPDGGNALEVYRQVMKLDPGNKLADQGLEQIERGFLDRALGATAQDDFAGADRNLADASSIRPGSRALLDTRTRIEGIRRQRATSILAQANSALDAGNADLAEQLAKKAQAMSSDVPDVDEFEQRLRNARLYASFSPGQVVTDNFLDRSGRAPALTVVPTGTFQMGSPDAEDGHRASEEPQREVHISVGFALGRDEISVGEFRAFASDAGYVSDAEKSGGSAVYDEDAGRIADRRGVSWKDDYHGEKAPDNLPVIHVTWNDAQAYVQWLSARTGKKYRLPSEAEFEYAMRAGSSTRYWWGDGDPGRVVANLTGDGDRSPSHRSWSKAFKHYDDHYWGPAPLASFPPNAFGLLDIDGNVSEWVEDCWHDNYVRAPSDSRAWVNPGCAQHVVRGGSWGSAPEQVRSAYRIAAASDTRSARVGFRVARDL